MKEIVPGIYTWSHFSEAKQINFNGWCIPSKEGTILVDPPPATVETIADIDAMGQVKAIILTNKDHVRDSDKLAGHFRAPVMIHQADGPLVSIRIGGVYRHGEELPGGLEAWRVLDAKSPGECALLCRASRALIIGDALIGKPAGQLTMLPAEKFAHPDKAVEGIRALLLLPFDAVLVGDGEPIVRGGRAAIETFLAAQAGKS